MKPWIKSRLTELMSCDDDIVVNYAMEMLQNENINPSEMQMNLTAFMDQERGYQFMEELWTHLLSASNNASGIPEEFLVREKEKILNKRREQEQIRTEINKRKKRVEEDVEGKQKRRRMVRDEYQDRSKISEKKEELLPSDTHRHDYRTERREMYHRRNNNYYRYNDRNRDRYNDRNRDRYNDRNRDRTSNADK
jgi:hypothetical protein